MSPRKVARAEKRRAFFEGGWVALCVAARLAGMPLSAITEFQSLRPRDAFSKRDVFDLWIADIDERKVKPKYVTDDVGVRTDVWSRWRPAGDQDALPSNWLSWTGWQEHVARKKERASYAQTATGMRLLQGHWSKSLTAKFQPAMDRMHASITNEYTDIWFNEAKVIDKHLLDSLHSRCNPAVITS